MVTSCPLLQVSPGIHSLAGPAPASVCVRATVPYLFLPLPEARAPCHHPGPRARGAGSICVNMCGDGGGGGVIYYMCGSEGMDG